MSGNEVVLEPEPEPEPELDMHRPKTTPTAIDTAIGATVTTAANTKIQCALAEHDF